jgi:succinate-semialdehyde dehydrogenase / glutarate-semialdehyde dehydrogenase
MMLESINPATETLITSYQEMSAPEIEALLEKTHGAFSVWRQMQFEERAACMKKAAELLRQNKSRYAELMALEMGKPLTQGLAEIDKCAATCDYYAENAERLLDKEVVETEAKLSQTIFRPLGVILAVMPWNFPFWQVIRFAAPNLMCGNTALIKHAPNVTGCAHALDKLFTDAGFPPNVMTFLDIAEDHVVERVEMLVAHPLVRGVTLTGSARAGRSIAETAGRYLKKCVLELGGSDPYIILDDANLDLAADVCANSRLLNSGQSCIAAKRFIVLKKVREEFEKRFVEKLAQKKIGSPLDMETDVGPLARKDLRDNLHRQVQESLKGGAELLLGGVIPEGKGYFYAPTVLTRVSQGLPVFDEETFGPVAAIITVKDEDDAVREANATPYGLGAAIFTEDMWAADSLIGKLDVGNCFVNAMVRSDARMPFGGVKDSGFGRELGSYGIKEFVNIKTVYVK